MVTAVAWEWWSNWWRRPGPGRKSAPPAAHAASPRGFVAPPTGNQFGNQSAAPDGSGEAARAGSEVKLPPMVTTDLYRLSKSGPVNVVDLTLPHTLDIHEFDRLNESILTLVRAEPEGQWVLDLSRLSYMGSAALGLMVNLRQQIKQSGGRLVLCGLSPQLLHIFKTCCMERLFRIAKTREDAIAEAS